MQGSLAVGPLAVTIATHKMVMSLFVPQMPTMWPDASWTGIATLRDHVTWPSGHECSTM